MRRTLVAAALVCLAATPAAAERPRVLTVWQAPTRPFGALGYNTIYLNRCTGGCVVRGGSTDSRTDHSSIAAGTLSAFSYGDATWNQVVQCMRDTFYPFNVNITDVDPGTANHFEIMIGGSPQELGLSSGVGGVSPATCGIIDNSLVFDFAAVWNGSVEEICSTAAQEISHSFGMDHVTDASDPMTYFSFTGRRYFKDNVKCGSDCQTSGGAYCKVGDSGCHGPYGQTCSTDQVRTCNCNSGSSTQNDIQDITTVFGPSNPAPPKVDITKPLNGAAVKPGFAVTATVDDPYGVSKAELRVDGQLVLSLTSLPYAFNAPDTLADGPHTVEVTGYDSHGLPGKTTIMVNIGPPCTKPADCPNNTDTCIGGRCVPGPGVQGGLGSTCTDGTECASGKCASDGTSKYCVEVCMKGQCPDTFGCLDDGTGTGGGVCWPGYDDGSGGGCSTDSGGPISLGLLFGALVLGRRRKRSRA